MEETSLPPGVRSDILEHMRKTSRFVRLLAIALFIGTVVLGISLFGIVFVSAYGGNPGAGFGSMLKIVGIFLFALMLGLVFCGFKCWRYASSLKAAEQQRTRDAFEEAIRKRRGLWASIGLFSAFLAVSPFAFGIFMAIALRSDF